MNPKILLVAVVACLLATASALAGVPTVAAVPQAEVQVQAVPCPQVAVAAVPCPCVQVDAVCTCTQQVAVAAVPATVEARIPLRDRMKSNRQHRQALRAARVQVAVATPVAAVAPACIGCSLDE